MATWIEYFYCTHCGSEFLDDECHEVKYSRTCASGDLAICPDCGEESSVECTYDPCNT